MSDIRCDSDVLSSESFSDDDFDVCEPDCFPSGPIEVASLLSDVESADDSLPPDHGDALAETYAAMLKECKCNAGCVTAFLKKPLRHDGALKRRDLHDSTKDRIDEIMFQMLRVVQEGEWCHELDIDTVDATGTPSL